MRWQSEAQGLSCTTHRTLAFGTLGSSMSWSRLQISGDGLTTCRAPGRPSLVRKIGPCSQLIYAPPQHTHATTHTHTPFAKIGSG